MGAIGLFGALADVDIATTGAPTPENDTGGLAHTLGVEGLWFGEQSTLGVQLGYLDSDSSDDEDLIRDAVYVRGLARHYFNESTLVQVEAAYLDGEMDDDDDDVEIISVGARLQHEMDFFPGDFNWPGKAYIAYRGDFAHQSGEDEKVNSHTILLGSTFTFGHSLIDNERNGAAFDLPAFARWNSIPAGPLEYTSLRRKFAGLVASGDWIRYRQLTAGSQPSPSRCGARALTECAGHQGAAR